ncbi:MAG: thioredoxin family protein [Nitrospirae bacterium]|nr:thioredoxin family protein [Nitrospirota bacterium]
MKAAILITFLFFVFTGNAQAEEKYAGKVNWHSLKEGMAKAKAEKKPVLVDFGVVKGCPRCEFLQKNVYSKDEIVNVINSDFVPVFIDLNKELSADEKVLGEKYDYKSDCLLLFLDYEGNVIKDPEGGKMCFVDKVEPEVFIKYLEQVKGNAVR